MAIPGARLPPQRSSWAYASGRSARDSESCRWCRNWNKEKSLKKYNSTVTGTVSVIECPESLCIQIIIIECGDWLVRFVSALFNDRCSRVFAVLGCLSPSEWVEPYPRISAILSHLILPPLLPKKRSVSFDSCSTSRRIWMYQRYRLRNSLQRLFKSHTVSRVSDRWEVSSDKKEMQL